MECKSVENTAKNINILGQFCGKRDIEDLTAKQLEQAYQIPQADVMVLLFHDIETADLSEAQVFAEYLKYQYGLEPDFLECKSTNCGNNITYLLELLKEKQIPYKSIIISQDATMQRRMEAGLKKYVDDSVQIINYAAYSAKVIVDNNRLVYEKAIRGMWNIERYISLLMGEIPRLSDDENGYGPKGKDFIAHVEIPSEVRDAFNELCSTYSELVRKANPEYASKP